MLAGLSVVTPGGSPLLAQRTALRVTKAARRVGSMEAVRVHAFRLNPTEQPVSVAMPTESDGLRTIGAISGRFPVV